MFNLLKTQGDYVSVKINGEEKYRYSLSENVDTVIYTGENNNQENRLIIENTLLSGKPIKGVINDGTMALITSSKEGKKRSDCISCGKCTLACPMKLFPNEILLGKSSYMKNKCISCGACEYVCPGGIPLVSMIKGEEENNNDQ